MRIRVKFVMVVAYFLGFQIVQEHVNRHVNKSNLGTFFFIISLYIFHINKTLNK